MLHYLFVFYYRPFGQMIKPMIDAVHPPGGHAVFCPGSSQPPPKPANQQAPATQPPSQNNQSNATTSQATSQSKPPTSNSASQSGSKTEAEKAVLFEEVLENVLECIYNSIAIHFKLCCCFIRCVPCCLCSPIHIQFWSFILGIDCLFTLLSYSDNTYCVPCKDQTINDSRCCHPVMCGRAKTARCAVETGT